MAVTDAQDQEWKHRLESNRRQLAGLARAFEQEAGLGESLAERLGDVMTRDYEDADFASAISDRETSDLLIHLLGENREQVERALERLREGKYGFCEDCGDAIAAERLRFRPEATRCVACQSRCDRRRRIA
ncbi:MAG: TraR/DksA family transcriptional regulator [Candidatus Dormibacteraceae bacterium]